MVNSQQDHDYQIIPMSSIENHTSPRGAIRQRGLLEGNLSPRSLASMSPFQLSTTKRYRHWWNMIYATIVLVCTVEVVLFLISVTLLSLASEPITFSTVHFLKLTEVLFLSFWKKAHIFFSCNNRPPKVSKDTLSAFRYYEPNHITDG